MVLSWWPSLTTVFLIIFFFFYSTRATLISHIIYLSIIYRFRKEPTYTLDFILCTCVIIYFLFYTFQLECNPLRPQISALLTDTSQAFKTMPSAKPTLWSSLPQLSRVVHKSWSRVTHEMFFCLLYLSQAKN